MSQQQSERMILVTGATGRQGGAVARQLSRRGFRVRGLTRDPNSIKAQGLRQMGVQVVQGDMSDRESIDRALDGVYGVFSVQDFWSAGYEGEIRQGRIVAEAAEAAGVRHFVYSSVGSAPRDTGIPHFDSKWQIEKYVRSLDLPATILRPAFFMDNWEMPTLRSALIEGKLQQPLSPQTSLQQVAVEDISVFVAMAFEDPDAWLYREMDLAGDELTMQQVADVFSRVLGRDVAYEQVPWGAFEQAVGSETTVMYRWFEDVGYSADIEACRSEHLGLISFETYLRRHGWEHVAAA